MRTSKLPTREAAAVEYVAQISPDGPLFVAGVSDGELINRLVAAGVGPLCACDIDGEKGANPRIRGSLNIYQADFLDFWQRSGDEGTFAAVVALGWPAKMDPRDPGMFGLVASCKWLLKPGGYFLMDWPEEMDKPLIIASALRHVGFKQVEGLDTATHPVYIWRKER